jgi:hypothetical protein
MSKRTPLEKKGIEVPKKSTETKPEAAHTEEMPTQQPAGSLEGTPVVALPKYNPYNRPATTREPDTTPIRQSYEDIQREAKGPGSEEWRAADKARAKLSELYRNLQEDERYAPAYKSERAWEEYQKAREQIEQLAPEARAKMLKSADSLERMSIPTPEHEGLLTKDTDKLLLTAHERNRVEGLLERAEKQAEKGPFERDPQDILKAEYERGLDEGGPGGGATVRAVYQLARDRGLDIHAIVEGHRKPHHHGALEDAERARMRANLVGKSVPEPPFPRPGRKSREGIGSYGLSRRKDFVSQERSSMQFKKRRPYWK